MTNAHRFFKGLAIFLALLLFTSVECNRSDDDLPTYVEPIAEFTASKTTVSVGEEIVFTDKSRDPNGTILTWIWEFGDGVRTRDRNPSHAYQEPGIYEVELMVFDDHSQSGSAQMSITVN